MCSRRQCCTALSLISPSQPGIPLPANLTPRRLSLCDRAAVLPVLGLSLRLCLLFVVQARPCAAEQGGARQGLAAQRGPLFVGSAGMFRVRLLHCTIPCGCHLALCRLGRFAFYRMVPRHTDAYSLCYSGEGCKASRQLLPLQPAEAQQQFTGLQLFQARQGCCIPHC